MRPLSNFFFLSVRREKKKCERFGEAPSEPIRSQEQWRDAQCTQLGSARAMDAKVCRRSRPSGVEWSQLRRTGRFAVVPSVYRILSCLANVDLPQPALEGVMVRKVRG